jgi:hypothetical protein
MAEHGEWNRKGAVLSDVTAEKEYGVSREFIVEGIQKGKLEYREGAVWGNPFLRVLRSQLEAYIQEQSGPAYLENRKSSSRLKVIKREIKDLKSRLAELEIEQSKLTRLFDSKS